MNLRKHDCWPNEAVTAALTSFFSGAGAGATGGVVGGASATGVSGALGTVAGSAATSALVGKAIAPSAKAQQQIKQVSETVDVSGSAASRRRGLRSTILAGEAGPGVGQGNGGNTLLGGG